MATTVDTLNTTYTLNAAGYQKGGRDVLGTTKDIASGIGEATDKLAKMALGLGAAAGGGLLALGKKAVDQAIGFDTLSRSLSAVTKSGERAKQILDFGDQLALPSIFESKDLDAAALTLEAFGLKTERFLPIAEKLGTVFGGTTDSLKEFVNALGEVKSGRTGRGFEELARAGISRDDLAKQYGLQFDKSGEFKGSVDQALDAIEKVVNDRFGKLSKEMADSPAAALGSLGDVTTRLERQLGTSILKVYLPTLTAVSDKLGHLAQDGTAGKVADEFAKLFNGKDIGNALVGEIDSIVHGIEQLPGYIDKNKDTFRDIFREAKEIGAILAKDAVPAMDRLLSTADRLLKLFTSLPEGLQSLILTLGFANKATGGLVGTVGGALGKIDISTKANNWGSADGAGGTLGGLLMKTITGPIGLIGSVLIAGAVSLADATSKGIKVLEGRAEDKGNVPNGVAVLDPLNGERVVDRTKRPGEKGYYAYHQLTPEEKEWFYQELRKVRKERELGIHEDDDDGEEDAEKVVLKRYYKRQRDQLTSKAQAQNATDSTPSVPVYQSLLQQIAVNTKEGTEALKTQLEGGSVLASRVTDSYGMQRALRPRRSSGVRNLILGLADAVEELEALAHANTASGDRMRVRGA